MRPSNAKHRWHPRLIHPDRWRPVARGERPSAPLPLDLHKHFAGAGILGREAADTSTISPLWRGETTFAAMHLVWNGKLICFPDSNTSSSPALPVRIDDSFVEDALFPNRIFGRLFHRFTVSMRRTDVRPISSRRAISALLRRRDAVSGLHCVSCHCCRGCDSAPIPCRTYEMDYFHSSSRSELPLCTGSRLCRRR